MKLPLAVSPDHVYVQFIRDYGRTILLSLSLLYGCNNDMNNRGVRQYVIKDGPVAAELTFPAGFNVKRSDQVLSLSCKFPEMSPWKSIEAADINIYVSVSEKRGTFADFYLRMATAAFDPKQPGLPYHAGVHNGFQVLHQGDPAKGRSGGIAIIYIFEAADGQLVMVHDPYRSSAVYSVYRNLAAGIELHYTIQKKFGSDFKQTDQVVIDFIKPRFRNISKHSA